MSGGLKIVWDSWNREHIKKHVVSPDEVEEVCRSSTIQIPTYKGRVIILGKTKEGRLLTVVCSSEKQKDYYVVSARDMSRKERQLYYEQTKTNQTI